jgi:hypothetical protein
MEFLDEPPESAVLTDYDRAHMALYLRLLDANTANADWQDAAAVLFGLDPALDPERARGVYDSHMARARWMTESGYRHLLDQSKS